MWAPGAPASSLDKREPPPAPRSLQGPFTLEAPPVATATSDFSPSLTSNPLPIQEAASCTKMGEIV